jgi:23S rRNA (uracil1939-C5)-methyltransferase
VKGGRAGYRRRRSRELEAVDRCPILAAPLEGALQRLPTDPEAQGAAEREWELALDEGGGVRATPLPARGGAPIALTVAGRRLQISPGVFAQGNRHLQDALAEAVRDAAAPDGEGGRLLELHAGAGTLTLALAARFRAVTAVEAHAAAARDLVANLRAAGVSHVRVLRARAQDALRDLAAAGPGPDVVVLDPPRAGLAAGGAELLAELGAARIAYLSCDPATLARDLSQLARRGYRLRRVRAFDLFPQTAHVEALAVVEREC